MENNTNQNPPHVHTEHKSPDHNMFMAILAYIGPLVIISYLVSKDDHFVKFHIKQGLALFVIEVIAWLIMSIFPMIWILWKIVHFGTVILSIVGIIYAIQGKEKELPLVGNWAKSFKI